MKCETVAVGLIVLATGIRLTSAEFAGSDIDVHSGPGAKEQVIATIPRCSEVEVTNRQGGWCSITYGRSSGWVPCDQLTKACTSVESEEAADSAMTTEGPAGEMLAPGSGSSPGLGSNLGGRIVGPGGPVPGGGTYD